jgi:hypothetical protein
MSLLQQDSPDLDDAARGEELTKGSSHVLWASILAGVIVSAGIAIYVITGQKPPAATGEIEQIWVHPQAFDQVYVFALVKLHNQSKNPLFLHNAMTNATMDDGIHSSYAATVSDYNRVFLAYPGIPVPHGKALSPQSTIEPGQTIEGTIVSAFRLSQEQWGARKDLNFSFGIQYQPDLVVAPHVPITVQ